MSALKDQQHELFLQELLKGKTQGEAYLAAGYKCKNASVASANANRLLKNDRIALRFAELQAAVTERVVEKASVSKTWVVDKLVENVDRAMQHAPVRRKTASGGEEEIPGEFVYNGSVANKALELIGKELGMFIDRKEVGGPGEFDRMSLDELREFVYGNTVEAGTKH